jgi:hypothetical protein
MTFSSQQPTNHWVWLGGLHGEGSLLSHPARHRWQLDSRRSVHLPGLSKTAEIERVVPANLREKGMSREAAIDTSEVSTDVAETQG